MRSTLFLKRLVLVINVVDDVVCFDFGRKVRDYICECLIVSGVLALTLVATAFQLLKKGVKI